MADTQDAMKAKKAKKAKEGSSSFFNMKLMKLDIPLLSKNKTKKLSLEEKQAAQFLAAQRGQINAAVDCGPDSGLGIAVDKDEAVLQVEVVGVEEGDKEAGEGSDTPPGKLNLKELYEECFEAKKSYELAVADFISQESKKGDAAAPAAPEPDETAKEATFEQLEEDIEQVEKDIKAAVKNLKGLKGKRKEHQEGQMAVARGLRRAFHKFGENARDIKSYVSLVPKSAGFGAGGLICGGMNIILKAAERYVVMDEHLESGLRGIKEAMVHKAYENKRHEPDRRMHQLISELFAIIFAVLESLLRWVHHQGTGKALLGAMLHPETFGQDLAKLIAQLKCKTGTLEKHGINLEMRETKRLMHSIKGTVEKSDAGLQRLVRGGKLQLEKLEDIRLGQEKNTAQVGAVGEAVGQEGAATRAQIRDLEYKLDQMAKSLSGARVVHNIFVLISQDPPQTRVKGQDRGGGVGVPLTARAAAQRATKRITQRQAPAAEPRIDAADVLAAVGFDAELTRVDGRSILRAARLSARDDQLVAEMTGHVRLQAFVEVPSSAVLFIEGGPNRQHEARGAISVVAAHVAAALARGRSANPLSVYALTHFCSEHRSRHDELGGTAMALVVTLLLQLIDQHRDFDTALLRECRDAVMNAPQEPTEDDVRACCDVLQRCVRALPREATLFCIVEGIAFFEGPKKRTAQTRVVLQRLLELASDEGQEGRARIKCLFTTPARSPEFIGLFKPYDVWTADAVNSSGFVPSLRRNSSWMVGRRR